jgi:hypothetical protein
MEAKLEGWVALGRLLVTASFQSRHLSKIINGQHSLARQKIFSKSIWISICRCHSWGSKSIAEALASLSLYGHPFLYNGHIFLPMRKLGPIFKVGTRVDSFPVYIIIRFETCCFSPSSILFWMPPLSSLQQRTGPDPHPA